MEQQKPLPMHTRLTELLGIDYPVIQGGLAYLSRASLAAAVSAAGGLGQLGVVCYDTPQELRADIQAIRAQTTRPFGVNFPIGQKPLDVFLQAALEEHVPAISITGGNPEQMIRAIQSAGVTSKILVLVAGVRAAKKAEELGAHVVMAVGAEGGGHLGRDDISTSVLVPRVVESISIPVVASGGIADGRGLAAALVLGATGVEMGTRFVAVRESNAHHAYQDALTAAQETDTVIIERSIGRPARVLRTPHAERILAAETTLLARNASREEILAEILPLIRGENNIRAALDGDIEHGFIWAGQVAGLIHDIPTSQDLIWGMIDEVRRIFQITRDL